MSKGLLTKEEPRDNWVSAAQLLTQTWSMSILVPEEGRKRWKRKPKLTTGMAAYGTTEEEDKEAAVPVSRLSG